MARLVTEQSAGISYQESLNQSRHRQKRGQHATPTGGVCPSRVRQAPYRDQGLCSQERTRPTRTLRGTNAALARAPELSRPRDVFVAKSGGGG